MMLTTVEPLDDRGSAVRFETQCVVIPDSAHRSRLPRVVTKSYTLPLWKRRTASPSTSAPSEEDDDNNSHLVLRVPILSLKPYSTTRTVDQTPLPPCLVHRSPSTSPSSPTSPLRNQHARIARKTSPSPSRADIITVPLRPCCAACQSVTEAAFIDGDAWPEHFSRGASRQRSMSVDGSPRTITVAGSAASASYGALGVSISVDEIDKRRRASDTETIWSNHLQEDSSFSSLGAELSPSRTTSTPPRIPEENDEDENELFPLPSPKRTPSTSPAGSLSSLVVTHPNSRSGSSPTPSSCSGDVPTKRHFLAPPPCASSSSFSLPKLSGSTTSLAEASPRVPSPDLLSTLPPLSGRRRSGSPTPPWMSCVPPTPTEGMPMDSTLKTPPVSVPVHIPIARPSSRGPSLSSSVPSATQTRLSWHSKRRVSGDMDPDLFIPSPAPAPASPSTHSKKSFSMSSPMQIFSDALRGVGAMGSPPGLGV